MVRTRDGRPRYDADVDAHEGGGRGDRPRPRCRRATARPVTWSLLVLLTSLPVSAPTLTLDPPAGASSRAVTSATSPGPRPAYRCSFNVNTDAFTGADGTASAIGWLADHNSVVTCLGGTFLVQDGPGDLFQNDGFGIYQGQRTTWVDAGGYLPAQVTSFDDQGASVSITEFADRIVVGWEPLRRGLQPRPRRQPDRPHGHGQPRGVALTDPAQRGA